MMDMVVEYGLFLAKITTVVIAIAVVVMLVVSLSRRARPAERLDVKHLNRKYEAMGQVLKRSVLPRKLFKKELKAEKSRKKAQTKAQTRQARPRKRIFVIHFRGDIKATAVASLREEVTAVLMLATPEDEVLVCLENAGGLVHEHGLAASQLLRLRQRDIPLTVAVDKVAASGGYLMACVAKRIIAAPFAVVGSIGVLAQLPNFHRLLDRHGVDFELIKAGEFKRTLTVFGRNTDKDREKMRQEVEDTHELFKSFVATQRPALDLARVGTGEHWYGARALEMKLVDELTTSDDYLLSASKDTDLYEISYSTRKTLSERLVSSVRSAFDELLYACGRQPEGRAT